MEWQQIVSVFVVPVVAALAGWVWTLAGQINGGLAAVRAELAAARLEIARDFARNGYVREVEERVLARLDRIDGKLDRVLGAGHG